MHSISSLLDKDDGIWKSSRTRWRHAVPNEELTWNNNLSGYAFIDKVLEYYEVTPQQTIVELGPGYGRLLTSLMVKNITFDKYVGIDISEQNITYLKNKFNSDDIDFIHADAESCNHISSYDLYISSLTMKHLYPTFYSVLKNVVRYANSDAMFIFDLIEGSRAFFEQDSITYIKQYTKDEVKEILDDVGLHLVAFSEVVHDSEHVRMIVVAKL